MQHPASSGKNAEEERRRKKLPIRQRLRIWDEEHPDEIKAILNDAANIGELSNSFTRPQNVTMVDPDIASPLFDGDELGDLRSEDANLNPGDMVELRYVRLYLSTTCIEINSISVVLKARDDRCWRFA